MKRISLLLIVLLTNYSVEANFVLTIKEVNPDSVKVYPTKDACDKAKAKAIKKDGKHWVCYPVDYN